MYFCPMIRIEVGDLTTHTMEEVWNGDRYVELRRRLLDNTLFPVCQRCCKVELSTERVTQPDSLAATGGLTDPVAGEGAVGQSATSHP